MSVARRDRSGKDRLCVCGRRQLRGHPGGHAAFARRARRCRRHGGRLQRRRAERRVLCRRSDAVWRRSGLLPSGAGCTRHDVFPMSWRTVLSFLWRRDFLIPHDGIRKLIEDHIPFRNLEEAHCRCISSPPTSSPATAVVLSEARRRRRSWSPRLGAFSPIRYKDYYLADGAISSNTPIQVAVKPGREAPDHSADRARLREPDEPPVGALIANAMHALTLLIARQLVSELKCLGAISSISWCRRYARWWAHPTISRELPIISIALFSPPTRGWRSTACSRARFRTRSAAQAKNAGAGPLRCTAKVLGRKRKYFCHPLSHPRAPARISYGLAAPVRLSCRPARIIWLRVLWKRCCCRSRHASSS